jgi:hypothetical protein
MATLSTKRSRCDDTGRAFAGSQQQIQFYVNGRRLVLNQAISDAFKTPFSLRWVSPLSSDRYREYWDSAFLKALGLSQHRKELSRFWPKGGPHWDALACVENPRPGGVLLVESKSHVPEIFGNGCGAEADSSIEKIDRAIAATKERLHVSRQADWKGSLYQSANRIAHLYFFREILGIEAWLANVYFTDDPHSPTSRTMWQSGIAEVKKSLGIGEIPHCADVFLPAV